ncbi:hypothetical protein H4Q26_012272 [Puccinia striiformis f. sp. tritici PST-130]|nr:hypothetical protein H4Q26_012272 [Puccinia striiformis f. sp. tritici PST-130]
MSVNHDEQPLNLTNSLNNLQLHQESETNRSESCIVEINSLKAELNTLNQRFVFLQQQFANMPTPPPASSPAHITSRSCPNKEVLIKDKVAKFVSLLQNPQLAAINVSAVNFNPQPQSWDNLVDVTGGGNFADMMMFGHEEFDFQAEQGVSTDHQPHPEMSPIHGMDE